MNPYTDDPGTPETDGRIPSNAQSPYANSHPERWEMKRQQHRHSHHSSADLHSHGLEALSAAALYSPPDANMIARPVSMHGGEFENPFDPSTPSRDHIAPQPSPPSAMSSSNNLNYILNPSSAMESPIDPSLVSPHEQHLRALSSSNTGLPKDAQDRYALFGPIFSQFVQRPDSQDLSHG